MNKVTWKTVQKKSYKTLTISTSTPIKIRKCLSKPKTYANKLTFMADEGGTSINPSLNKVKDILF